MKPLKKQAVHLLSVCVMLALLPMNLLAWEPNTRDWDAAIETGDFGDYFTNISAWLNKKAPASISAAAMKTSLKDPVFANALAQRQFIARHGLDGLGTFAKADPKNQAFLSWLMRNTEAMDLYLVGAAPSGAKKREANTYRLDTGALDTWRQILNANPDSKEGLYLRLAIATGLSPSPAKSYGSGVVFKSLPRYKHFETAHKNKELFPSFDSLSVWDLRMVVYSWASDRDLGWVRNMVNTWRPDLRKDQRVVHIVSEVWRRNSPYYPFADGFVTVLEGGGKCGPRSWFGEMTCKAFGMPAMAMSQPGHSAIVYKSPYPQSDPQPGTAWKVVYGAGWHRTRGGYQLLTDSAARDRASEFEVTEHLTWLASTLTAKPRIDAVLAIVHTLQAAQPLPGRGPNPAIGADSKPTAIAKPPVEAPAPKSVPEEPFKAVPGVIHVEAETFTKMSGVKVYDCFTGGKQVNFQKNIQSSWIDYTIDAPKAGTYALTIRHAVANREQILSIQIGDRKPTNIKIPNTNGLWKTSPAVDVTLNKGPQTLRIAIPYQRGIALRWFELKVLLQKSCCISGRIGDMQVALKEELTGIPWLPRQQSARRRRGWHE